MNLLGGIETFVYQILLTIDAAIYKVGNFLYEVFIQIASAQLFTDAAFADFTNRIYMVIGIIALFILTYSLIIGIVNPDKKEKSGSAVAKKLIIALVVVPLVPVVFQFLYLFQESILGNNVIFSFFLGNPEYTTQTSSDMYITVASDIEGSDAKYICELGCTSEQLNSECFTEGGDCPCIVDYGVISAAANQDEAVELASADCISRYGVPEEYIGNKYYTGLYKNVEKYDPEVDRHKIVGNFMTYSIMSAFLHPFDGNEDVLVTVPPDFVNNPITWALIGCVFLAAAASVVAIIATPVTGGASILVTIGSAVKVAASVAPAACGVGFAGGLLANSIIGSIATLVAGETFNWTNATSIMLLTGEFNNIIPFSQAIVDGQMNYMPIVSTIAALFYAYLMATFCIDIAVRAVKLAFLQLIAPVPIFMSVLPSNDNLIMSWVKKTLATYFEVFVRIAIFAGAVYLILILDTELISTMNPVAQALIYIGILLFVKQLPALLSEITGIKSGNMKLGIKSKLQDSGILTAGKYGAKIGRAGGAAVGAGITAGVKNWRKSKNLKNSKFGKSKRTLRMLSGIGGGFGRGAKAGWSEKGIKGVATGASKGVKNYEASQRRNAARNARYNSAGNSGFFGNFKGRILDAKDDINAWSGVGADYETLKHTKEVFDTFLANEKAIGDNITDIINEAPIRNSELLSRGSEWSGGKTLSFIDNLKKIIDSENFNSETLSDGELEYLLRSTGLGLSEDKMKEFKTKSSFNERSEYIDQLVRNKELSLNDMKYLAQEFNTATGKIDIRQKMSDFQFQFEREMKNVIKDGVLNDNMELVNDSIERKSYTFDAFKREANVDSAKISAKVSDSNVIADKIKTQINNDSALFSGIDKIFEDPHNISGNLSAAKKEIEKRHFENDIQYNRAQEAQNLKNKEKKD